MKTVTIQIGNTDNKLTQQDWAQFCLDVHNAILPRAKAIHFHGTPPGNVSWQNAAWVFEIEEAPLAALRENLAMEAKLYRQDSIALTVGTTEFIGPAA